MTAATNRGLRRCLAAVLILALTLAGLGRAAATAAPSSHGGAPALGFGVPICHAGGADAGAVEAPDGPARPVPHDCCDDCALLAGAVLPAPPSLAGPVRVARAADPARPPPRAPAGARPRDHRLARGPPAA